jgi:hypothetical protein
MTTKPLTVPNGVGLGNETLSTYDEGSFVGTPTGFSGATTPATITVYYTLIGKQVTLRIAALSGTSNATSFTITGLPTALIPARDQDTVLPVYRDNGTLASPGFCRVTAAGLIELGTVLFGAWTNSGTKAIGGAGFVITYTLN